MGCDKLSGKVDAGELKALRDKLQQFSKPEREAFFEDCTKNLAARLWQKVDKNTPVGVYPKKTGKTGGTLRRGWTLKINKSGNTYIADVINPVEYASYVEYGHRTRSHKGWVSGQFMLTKSVAELEQVAPAILEAKIKKKLEEVLK